MVNYEVLTDEFGTSVVKKTVDNSSVVDIIPMDESNSDYQRYLRWLENPDAEEGGTL